MTADFRPTMRRTGPVVAQAPAPPPEPAPHAVLEALLQRLAVRKDEPAPRPSRWEFIPERDANNLIVRITATPFYD